MILQGNVIRLGSFHKGEPEEVLMKRLVAITAAILICGPALAQDRGPAPQTGKEHPEVLKGAKESGAMDTTMDHGKGTTGMNKKGKDEAKKDGMKK
jgi:hypothetical protein